MSLLFCIESIILFCFNILYKRSYIVYFEVTLYTGTLIFLFCELFYVIASPVNHFVIKLLVLLNFARYWLKLG